MYIYVCVYVCVCVCVCVSACEDTRGLMVIVVGNGLDDPCSNPKLGCLHLT